jgi:hypothetical protein
MAALATTSPDVTKITPLSEEPVEAPEAFRDTDCIADVLLHV